MFESEMFIFHIPSPTVEPIFVSDKVWNKKFHKALREINKTMIKFTEIVSKLESGLVNETSIRLQKSYSQNTFQLYRMSLMEKSWKAKKIKKDLFKDPLFLFLRELSLLVKEYSHIALYFNGAVSKFGFGEGVNIIRKMTPIQLNRSPLDDLLSISIDITGGLIARETSLRMTVAYCRDRINSGIRFFESNEDTKNDLRIKSVFFITMNRLHIVIRESLHYVVTNDLYEYFEKVNELCHLKIKKKKKFSYR